MNLRKKLFQTINGRPKMALFMIGLLALFLDVVLAFFVYDADDKANRFLIYLGVSVGIVVILVLIYKVLNHLFSTHFSIRKYFLSKPVRKVSVVVPNYNYADYLKERIDTIVSQTYPIYELIILDDASTDNSVEVIKGIINNLERTKPDLKVRFIPNRENSGSVFLQWEKAFLESEGDFVWIAEADDSCSKYFLNSVMRAFDDRNVVLSYAESCATNKDGKKIMPDLRAWTDEFRSGHWDKSYISDGKKELKDFLCINNTIPNVSGVVFRKIKAPIKEYLKGAQRFRLVGDWYFYAKYLLNGEIAYFAESLNYRRLQEKGVTSTTDKCQQFLEIVEVQKSIEKDVKISYDVKKKVEKYRGVVMASFGLSEEELKYMKTPFKKVLNESKVKDEVLLSIIVPAYNSEKYIDVCLDSLQKALPERSEIIVVDDGSTDETADIVKRHLGVCPEMKYFYKKNGGPASARNFGLAKARGRYVIFMDADDEIRSNGYQVMLMSALEHDADIVVCDMALIYDDKVTNCSVYHKDPGGLKGFLVDGLMASSNNKIVKKKLYEAVGGYPEEKNNEDVAVIPVLMAMSKNTQYIPSSFYKYYQRKGSIQNSDFDEGRLEIFDTVEQADEKIRKILSSEADEIFEIMVGNQLLALLVHVIANIDNVNKRNKAIREFCKKYKTLRIYNGLYIDRYCREYYLDELPQYILEASPEKIYNYIKNNNKITNFLDYIGRAFGIKVLTKKNRR